MASYPSNSGSEGKRARRVPDTNTHRQAMTPEIAMELAVDFLRRWGVPSILLSSLVAAIIVGVLFFQLPLEYRSVASARIQVPDDVQVDGPKQSEMDLIKSNRVIDLALNQKETKSLGFVQNSLDPRATLQNWLKVETNTGSEIVTIALTGTDPEEITTLVNAVLDAYVSEAQLSRKDGGQKGQKELEESIRRKDVEIEKLQLDRSNVAKSVKMSDPDSVINQLNSKRTELSILQGTVSRFVGLIKKHETDLKGLESSSPLDQAAVQSIFAGDAEYAEDLKKVENIEKRMADIKATEINGENSTDYIDASADLRKIRNRIIQKKKAKLGPAIAVYQAGHERNIQRAKSDLLSAQEELQSVEATIKTLRQDIEQLDAAEAQLKSINNKIAGLREEKAMESRELKNQMFKTNKYHVQVQSHATVPRLPSPSKKRFAMIGGGGVAGFGLVMALFILADYRMKVFARPEQLQRSVSLPVIGILPSIPRDRRIPTDEDFMENNRHRGRWLAMQEAINSLRITLTFAPDRRNEGLNCLMITSARDGEGKSTLTAQLAISLARSGVRVVVVEADMHRPTQFSTFGLDRTPGLTDVLQGRIDVAEVVQETRYPNLHMLTAGVEVGDVSSLLNPEKLTSVFNYLKKNFQTVLIDAPPVLPVSDALVLGRQADQTLLMAMCNHSQVFQLQQASHRLDSVGVQIVGIVATGVSSGQHSRYYGYTRDYYSRSTNVRPSPYTVDRARRAVPKASDENTGAEASDSAVESRSSNPV